MRALVVYESMYGNTHLVADEVAAGIREAVGDDVAVAPVRRVDAATLDGVDLLVVGGPTHVHGLTRPKTREAAVEAAAKTGSDLVVEPDAEGDGLREWLEQLDDRTTAAAAFDTRLDAPPAFTGRASKGIAKRLRELGCDLVVEPQSFLVTKQNHLVADEAAHAHAWGVEIGTTWLER